MPFPISPESCLFEFDMETSVEIARSDLHSSYWQKHVNDSADNRDITESDVKHSDHVYTNRNFKFERGGSPGSAEAEGAGGSGGNGVVLDMTLSSHTDDQEMKGDDASPPASGALSLASPAIYMHLPEGSQNLPSPNAASSGPAASQPANTARNSELCAICDDRATGRHYGANSCDGCKGFFRRSVRKNHEYKCRYNRNCVVDKDKRNQCRYCRLRRCFRAGMRKSAVQNERDRIGQPTRTCEEYGANTEIPVGTLIRAQISAAQTADGRPLDHTFATGISYQGDARELPVALIEDITESMKQQLLVLVEWAKLIPPFQELHLDDQVSLLRTHSADHLILGVAERSLQQSQVLVLANDRVVPRIFPRFPALGRIVTRVLDELVLRLRDERVDRAELACLRAAVFFDPTVPGLNDSSKVRHLRRRVLQSMDDLMSDKQYEERGRFGEVLLLLPVIRQVSTDMVEQLRAFKNNGYPHIDSLLDEMLLGGYTLQVQASTNHSEAQALVCNPSLGSFAQTGATPSLHADAQTLHSTCLPDSYSINTELPMMSDVYPTTSSQPLLRLSPGVSGVPVPPLEGMGSVPPAHYIQADPPPLLLEKEEEVSPVSSPTASVADN